jgi:hypothetical protein
VEPLTARLGEQSQHIVQGAIATAEAFANGVNLDMSTVDEAARAAARAADVERYGSALASTIGTDAINAARAAWAAAESARVAHASAGARARPGADFEARLAAQTAEAADDAATAAAGVDAASAARADLSRLIELNLGAPGQLGQPIDVTESGPLGPDWPNGAPEWYRSHP